MVPRICVGAVNLKNNASNIIIQNVNFSFVFHVYLPYIATYKL